MKTEAEGKNMRVRNKRKIKRNKETTIFITRCKMNRQKEEEKKI
jgi:hypothetical protein